MREKIAGKVIFIPAGLPWQKGSTLTATPLERAELVAKAIAEIPEFQLSTREIERPGATYTIDSVREFQKEFPADEFVLLLGSDAFNGIRTWKDFEKLIGMIDIVVAVRPGEKVEEIDGAQVRIIESEMFDISSTHIRLAAKTGANLSEYVPDSIIDDVKKIYGA